MIRMTRVAVLCVIAACVQSADPETDNDSDDDATADEAQEVVTLPSMIIGNTAYSLGYEDPPGRTYRQVIDWNASQGVNLLRIDAPKTTLTSASMTRLKSLISYATSKSMSIALGTGILADLTTTQRAQYASTLATNLCNETRVFLERDWEASCDGGVSITSFNAATNQLRAAFVTKGCAIPSIAVHVKRNNNYAGTSSGYHGTNPCKENFNGQAAINLRGLHEAGKLEGYGVSEPGLAHPLIMEVLYEDLDGRLVGGNVDATLWANEGVASELNTNSPYFYRWYAAGALLSGGRGLVYGMAGASPFGGQRWAWGLPDGGTSAGLPAVARITHYLQQRGFSPLTATPADQLVDNGFAGHLKRAKAATLAGTLFIYNPRETTVKISNQAGKVIDLYDPERNVETDGIATITSSSYTFHPPTTLGHGDYILVVRSPTSTTTKKINFQSVGSPAAPGYAVDDGQVYGARSGMTYGWNVDHTSYCRDRNLRTDQRLDTFCHFRDAGSRWELAVPNGTYHVTVSVGDAGFTSDNTISVEGVSYWSHLELGANDFAVATKTVTVSDGRLTITNGSNVFPSTKIDYVEVGP